MFAFWRDAMVTLLPVRSTLTATFSSMVWRELCPQDEVVDLGAGNDCSPRSPLAFLAERTKCVTAVDIEPCPEKPPRNVDWWHGRIEDWHEERKFFALPTVNAFIARNSLQFLEKKWVLNTLLPDLAAMLEPGGIVAIATFYAQPDPPVTPPYLSLYHLSELRSRFPEDWKVRHGVEEVLNGRGYYNNVNRDWFTTQLVIKRPC